jgi:hypothetical protein
MAIVFKGIQTLAIHLYGVTGIPNKIGEVNRIRHKNNGSQSVIFYSAPGLPPFLSS